MFTPAFLNALALCSLIPATVLPLRQSADRDGLYWIGMSAAVFGSGAWAAHLLSGAWQTDFGTTLWVSVAVVALLFTILSAANKSAWRLTPILAPYLLAMAALASAVRGAPTALNSAAPALWLDIHIVVSVLTYAFLTLAAVASAAVFLQERALKRKSPNRLTRLLPAVRDSEILAGRLLVVGEAVLGLGLASGMAIQFLESGSVLRFDHKILLSLIAFVLIGALLLGHRVCGVRGRLAARVVMVSYLLLTLAYPGVKFVTQVLR